jgi:hypothetical protein
MIVSEASKVILGLAARPDGVSCAEASAATELLATSMSSKLEKMRAAGHLVKAGHVGQRLRWFTSAVAAREWKRRTRGTVGAMVEPGSLTNEYGKTTYSRMQAARKTRAEKLPAEKPSVDGVTIKPSPKRGEVIYPPGFMVTIIPSPEFMGEHAQVQVSAKAKIAGGFSSLGIGRYL